MIIEDYEKFADLLVNFAQKRGYECVCAKNGQEGLALARRKKPDAISLDIGLPDIDGMVVLQE